MESLEDFLRMLIEYNVNLIASLLSTINIDTDQDKVGVCTATSAVIYFAKAFHSASESERLKRRS